MDLQSSGAKSVLVSMSDSQNMCGDAQCCSRPTWAEDSPFSCKALHSMTAGKIMTATSRPRAFNQPLEFLLEWHLQPRCLPYASVAGCSTHQSLQAPPSLQPLLQQWHQQASSSPYPSRGRQTTATPMLPAAGLIKVVFATETLAAGINMPARTTLLSSLSRRRDGQQAALMHNELLQMAGRAGRRGFDTAGGFMLVAHGPLVLL